jgi:hypothetical protein
MVIPPPRYHDELLAGQRATRGWMGTIETATSALLIIPRPP